MSEKELTSHDVNKPVLSTQNIEEYEEILKKYKKLNPSKYEAKEANGEFDAYRDLIDPARAKAKAEKLAKEEAKKLDEAKKKAEAEAKEEKAKADKEAKTGGKDK